MFWSALVSQIIPIFTSNITSCIFFFATKRFFSPFKDLSSLAMYSPKTENSSLFLGVLGNTKSVDLGELKESVLAILCCGERPSLQSMELSECGATLLVSEFRSWNVQIEIVINVIVPIVLVCFQL